MKRIKYAILTLFLVSGIGLFALPASVSAVNPLPACSDVGDSRVCAAQSDALPAFANKLVNGLLYILGAVSVIVIVISGILFATSSGNAASVKRAKDTLLYAVVGLLVALFSFAIVNYVIAQFQ